LVEKLDRTELFHSMIGNYPIQEKKPEPERSFFSSNTRGQVFSPEVSHWLAAAAAPCNVADL
jgi:hypothetical protein